MHIQAKYRKDQMKTEGPIKIEERLMDGVTDGFISFDMSAAELKTKHVNTPLLFK